MSTMHSVVGVVCYVFIYCVVSASCGVLEKQVTKYEMETVQLSCNTEIDGQIEWGIRSVFQRHLLRTAEGQDGYRRIYSTAGLQTAYILTGRYSISEGNGFCNLTIKNLNISESGEYVCWEDLGSGPATSTQLSVYVNVSMLETPPSSHHVIEGNDITLPCQNHIRGPVRWMYTKSIGSPQSVIHNSKLIESECVSSRTSLVIKPTCNLLLHNVRLNQSGLYLCVEDWGAIHIHPIQLIVFVNISTIEPSVFTIRSGSSLTLPCQVSRLGNSVRWCYAKTRMTPQVIIFDRHPVDLTFIGRASDSVHVDNSSRDYNLTIQNVQTNESGWYICFDDNSVKSYVLNVYVNSSTLLQSCQNKTVVEGENITLPCQASVDGALRWFYATSPQQTPHDVIFHDNSLDQKYNGLITVDHKDLSLHSVRIHQYGWYICIVDSIVHSFLLDVLVNVELYKTHVKASVDIGDNVTLFCPSNNSDPVRWWYKQSERALQQVIFSDSTVESQYIGKAQVDQTNGTITLSLYDVHSDDLGWYICVVDANVHPIKLTEKDHCISLPCYNRAVCDRISGGYHCKCLTGFTGQHCETEDHCVSLPCYNRATCVRIIDGYQCVCLSGYTGLRCDSEEDHCVSSPCYNRATCVRISGGYQCVCLSEYTGLRCDSGSHPSNKYMFFTPGPPIFC